MLDARLIDLARRWMSWHEIDPTRRENGWSKVDLSRRLGIAKTDKSLNHALPVMQGYYAKLHGTGWDRIGDVFGLSQDLFVVTDIRQRAANLRAYNKYVKGKNTLPNLEAVMKEICPALLDALHRKV